MLFSFLPRSGDITTFDSTLSLCYSALDSDRFINLDGHIIILSSRKSVSDFSGLRVESNAIEGIHLEVDFGLVVLHLVYPLIRSIRATGNESSISSKPIDSGFVLPGNSRSLDSDFHFVDQHCKLPSVAKAKFLGCAILIIFFL